MACAEGSIQLKLTSLDWIGLTQHVLALQVMALKIIYMI